ncbi:hypothetical protein LEP1GSC050_2675 [Leptospira broomii serovar Hurstbridge str. 5399]|uniref:4Fe-4S ferredoxin-type domain-containing protein n=1 Tax=Leptospira broomii serovar Hurstbridge str. 5399 TaxID=1049789 RepID=T0FEU8_9LEPT|nr:oxidoreductase [Leptospira broomii]EQA46102.1 hypothetical protein LEP1GSC050_2675 [Leptospira broomii serovar Hurstbridge str. 5399]
MFAKPFLLKPRTVKDAGTRKTVLDEPYTLIPDGGALLLKEFPARVKVGDSLFKQSSGTVLSPVNGVASLAHGETGTRVQIVQDGIFPVKNELHPKIWKKEEAIEVMDRLGLVSLDFPGQPLSDSFRERFKPRFIILSPYTRSQDIDFTSRLRTDPDCHKSFIDSLKLWFPETEIRDYILDKKIPLRNYAYPWGIPEYFTFKTEKIPFSRFKDVIYLGPETLYYLYRALFGGMPFIEREISLFFLGKNGGLRKAGTPLRVQNGQNLKFLFEEYEHSYSQFTLNSFFEYYPVRDTKEGFYWDIRLYSSLILLARHEAARSEFPCVECGECSLNCPTKSNPMALTVSLGQFQPGLCMECGICTFLCPSFISLRDRIRSVKEESVGI